MKSTGVKKYIIWLIASSLVCITLVVLVTIFNDQSINDMLYVADTVGVGLCIAIISSVIVMIFFNKRDTKYTYARERNAARKIAAEIRHYSRSDANTTKLSETYRRVEYLYDAFHSDLDENLSPQIDKLLQKSPQSEDALIDIMTLIDKKYPK